MVRESFDVLRHNEMDSLVATLNITDLQDLGVVAEHIWSHLEWRNIDNVYIGVFGGENSTDLSIFALEEFVHRDSLGLFDRERVDMDLNAFAGLDGWPLLTELLHHLFPDEE